MYYLTTRDRFLPHTFFKSSLFHTTYNNAAYMFEVNIKGFVLPRTGGWYLKFTIFRTQISLISVKWANYHLHFVTLWWHWRVWFPCLLVKIRALKSESCDTLSLCMFGVPYLLFGFYRHLVCRIPNKYLIYMSKNHFFGYERHLVAIKVNTNI